ncbi:cadmium, cobalt and zinc/H(+)-K(+) antiporter [mine drainage metagenome]|uniref:Cadmium, cobalt and zinc/H(+)-K(+) antiporter n=1 Tax=mine drainage metagenome TaxID=410659 RepID=A0A1J5QX74_9ZZZZ
MSGHQHAHHHHAPGTYNRAFGFGIAFNIGFVLIESFYGWQSHSLALLADAGHNLSDVLGLVMAWSAIWMAGLRPDDRHTYGWQRASIMAALINALVLLFGMGSMAWEAVHRFSNPAPIAGQTVMLVAASGVLVNGVTAWLFMSGGRSDINIRGAFMHMAADTLVSLGVVLAGGIYLLTGWSWLDPVTSLVIALLVVLGTWHLFRQSLHLAFDGVPQSVKLGDVRDYLAALPGVVEVHDLHVWAMGSAEIALTAHLVMPSGHPGDVFVDGVLEWLHDEFDIEHATLQIEIGDSGRPCRLATHTHAA